MLLLNAKYDLGGQQLLFKFFVTESTDENSNYYACKTNNFKSFSILGQMSTILQNVPLKEFRGDTLMSTFDVNNT